MNQARYGRFSIENHQSRGSLQGLDDVADSIDFWRLLFVQVQAIDDDIVTLFLLVLSSVPFSS